jgi:hypothetical protein
MDDLKAFRLWGSRTPGQPENFETAGVEVTTGLPLEHLISSHFKACLPSCTFLLEKTMFAELFSMLFRSSGAALFKCCWTSACGGETLGCSPGTDAVSLPNHQPGHHHRTYR